MDRVAGYTIYGNAKALVTSRAAAVKIAEAARRAARGFNNPVMGLAPSSEHRSAVAAVLRGSAVLMGVQTLCGETPESLMEIDDRISYVVANHVERRTFTDEVAALPRQIEMARKSGVKVVLLLGSAKGQPLSKEDLRTQITNAFKEVDITELNKLGIDLVYEPGESIGLDKPAPLPEIEQAFRFIAAIMSESFPQLTNYRLLNGGSVAAETFSEVKDLRDHERFGGFIVGGASARDDAMVELGLEFARLLGTVRVAVPAGEQIGVSAFIPVENKSTQPLRIAVLGRPSSGDEVVNNFLASLSSTDGIEIARLDRGKMGRGDVAAAIWKDAFLTVGLDRGYVRGDGDQIKIGDLSVPCQPIKGKKAEEVLAALAGSSFDVLVVSREDLMTKAFLDGARALAKHILLVPDHRSAAKAQGLADLVLVPGINQGVFDPSAHRVIMLPFDEDMAVALVHRTVSAWLGEGAVKRMSSVTLHHHTGEAPIANRGVGAENQGFLGAIRPFPVREVKAGPGLKAQVVSTRQPMLYAGTAIVDITVTDPEGAVNREAVKEAFDRASQSAPQILAIASNADGTLMFARERVALTFLPSMVAVTNPSVLCADGERQASAVKHILVPVVFGDLGTAHQLKRALWAIGNALV